MSSIGWIDFSSEHREKVRKVIDLLSAPGVVDELGIGVIRDSFADQMFPGLLTFQTRAKYFTLTALTRDLVESILTRWKKSGLCDPSDVLILHAQSDITRSPLGDRRILGVHNLRECTEQEDAPNTIRHTSIHKAKGLDSKAVILIGLQPHKDLATDYDHFSWFMAVSRARQLLAIVEMV